MQLGRQSNNTAGSRHGSLTSVAVALRRMGGEEAIRAFELVRLNQIVGPSIIDLHPDTGPSQGVACGADTKCRV